MEIVNLIPTLGFPVVACCACFWYLTQADERHREEVNKLSEAINNNTLVIRQLLDKIGG